MKRRLFCLLCVLLLLFPVLAPAEEVSEDSNFSFDFDFAFTLNAHAFPKQMRSRVNALRNKLNEKPE